MTYNVLFAFNFVTVIVPVWIADTEGIPEDDLDEYLAQAAEEIAGQDGINVSNANSVEIEGT